MQIVNTTRNTVLAESASLAESPLKRIKGLLGRKSFPEGEALIIRPCNSIHTFCMSFPIDILFVDSRDRIVKTIAHLSPFRVSGIYFLARFVIELPAGTIERTSSCIGDQIRIA